MKLKLFSQHQQHVSDSAPAAAEGSEELDAYDKASSPEPQLLGDPEPSQPGSVRTPADLSHEPSAVAVAAAAGGLFVEASAGSQQLLPNLLMSEEELLGLVGLSRASSVGSRKDPNPSSYGAVLAAERSSGGSCRATHTSMAGSSAAEGSGGSSSSSPMAKALFVDAALPSTPKSCSHSNLRVMASRNTSEWQQGPGGASSSSHGSSMHGSRCYSNNSSMTAHGGDIEDGMWEAAAPAAAGSGSSSSSKCASQQFNLQWPSGSRSAAADSTAGCSMSGSNSRSSLEASHKSAAAAAAAVDDKAEDEDLLLADMDVCLGSLQTAVQLARSSSSGGQRSLSGTTSGSGAASTSAAAARGGVRWSLSSSGSRGSAAADAAVDSLHGGAAAEARQMQRSKSRLGNGQLETPAAGHQLRVQVSVDSNPVLLKVGSKGRPVALSEGGRPSTVNGSVCNTEFTVQRQQQQHVRADEQQCCEAPVCAQEQQQQLAREAEGAGKHSSLAGTAAAAAGHLGMPRSRLSEGDLLRLQRQQQQQQQAIDVLLQQQRSRPQSHKQQQQEKQKQQRMQSAYGTASDSGSKAKRHDGLLGWFMHQGKHNRTGPAAHAGIADGPQSTERREVGTARSSREVEEQPKWGSASTVDAVEPYVARDTQPPQQQQLSLRGDLTETPAATAPTYARGSSGGGSRDAAELQRPGSSSGSGSDSGESFADMASAVPKAVPFFPQPPSSSRPAAVGPAPRRLQVAGQGAS